MSYMDLVTSIANEMKGTADFFTSRQKVMGLETDNSKEIANQLAENVILQINRLPTIRVDGAQVLNDAVGNSGCSAEGMKKNHGLHCKEAYRTTWKAKSIIPWVDQAA